jgi:subtilisin family serine protease
MAAREERIKRTRKRGPKKKPNNKCKLLPYKREDILSMQDVRQYVGWNITAFDLPEAWSITQGEGVTVAVLDTGCDLDHPDLEENLLPGMNFVNKRKKPNDDNQHGTHVTGIICALDNHIGMVGVAPRAKVLPVKVLDSKGNGNLLNVAKGIRWAVAQGADLICMSLGASRPIQQVRKALQFAEKRGVVAFVAAGNAGKTKQVYYPAAYPETIAIGSIDEDFDRSGFSNTGNKLDFMAPGGKIFSTVPDNWYAFLSGTSMAAPFACGVAALLLSYAKKNNGIKLKGVGDYRRIFKDHTTPIKNRRHAGKRFFEGFGIIDPRKFVESLDD